MDTYLKLSRGPMLFISSALCLSRAKTKRILLLAVVTTFIGLFAAPITGNVYSRREERMPFKSIYESGGDTGGCKRTPSTSSVDR